MMDFKKENTVISLYIAFGICVVLTCLPYSLAQNIAALFSIAFIVTAYIKRKGTDASTIDHNHIRSIIRTFWIWSSFFVLGMMLAGWIISKTGDMTAIDTLTQSAMSGGIPTEDDINRAGQEYWETNFGLIVKTTFACLAPAQFYAAWKISTGYKLYQENKEVTKAIL